MFRDLPDRPRPLSEFGDLLQPSEAQEPILGASVRGALLEWLTEIWAADELAAVGLSPRRRALFLGPPGVGKTTLAHHLAARLGLPMLVVRADRIVAKYLGEMERNMAALFDAVADAEREGAPVALFFDEFETFARKRHADSENAQRAVDDTCSLLLQRLEAHGGLVIAATNLADGLDPAVWRRFDLRVTLEMPGEAELRRILARYLAPYGLPAASLAALAEACVGASPALARQLCEGLKRNLVIGPKVGWAMGREAVIGRVLAGISPPPGIGAARLWSRGVKDRSVESLPWPLPLAGDVVAEAAIELAPSADGVVTPIRRGAR